MQRVFVLDKNREPLMPCHPARARKLLKNGRARVFRRYPFTIILTDREGGDVQPVALKVDPGSRTSGLALVADFQRGKRVIWAAELTHRGQQIKDALLSRRLLRRGRRSRKTRYRPARFLNRRRRAGWLPPSVQSRVANVFTWANRLYRWSPLCAVSLELVKFDTQKSRLMCRPDKYGFPRTKAKQGRVQYGFQTGDIVKADVPKGKKTGTYIGRVAVRRSGNFNITTRAGTVQGISYRYCTHHHKSDGYSYEKGEGVPPHS
jgi:hypothetical protein